MTAISAFQVWHVLREVNGAAHKLTYITSFVRIDDFLDCEKDFGFNFDFFS